MEYSGKEDLGLFMRHQGDKQWEYTKQGAYFY